MQPSHVRCPCSETVPNSRAAGSHPATVSSKLDLRRGYYTHPAGRLLACCPSSRDRASQASASRMRCQRNAILPHQCVAPISASFLIRALWLSSPWPHFCFVASWPCLTLSMLCSHYFVSRSIAVAASSLSFSLCAFVHARARSSALAHWRACEAEPVHVQAVPCR